MTKSLYKLWKHLEINRKKQFIVLLFQMVFVSISEVVGIGAVLPLLAILVSPEKILLKVNNIIPNDIIKINGKQEFVVFTIVIFGIISLIVASLRLHLLWKLNKFSLNVCSEIAHKIFKNTIYKPYRAHIETNSSEIIDGLLTQTNSVIYNTVLPLMTFISSIIMASIILIALIFYSASIALQTLIFMGFLYLLIKRITKKRMFLNSKILASESINIVKIIQESLGAIREILLDGGQQVYLDMYQKSNIPLRRAQASISFIGGCPRYIIEGLGMVAISILAYSAAVAGEGELLSIVPFLGLLALGAQRLLPIFQQIYASLVSINAGEHSLNSVLNLLSQQYVTSREFIKEIKFNKNIRLDNIHFKYKSDEVINGLDLTISKGECIGFIGKTGAGKSTLFDIIMGLLMPTSGKIIVDEEFILDSQNIYSWQGMISHVPQSIFLSDASIIENIALGVKRSDIDIERIDSVINSTQLYDFVKGLPEGVNTKVGERGVSLSGGQRQRIGIARALYKKAEIIIFDEATSALDTLTENEIMETIYGLDKKITILIISHRISTLRKCNKIVEIEKGKISNITSARK